MAPWYDSVVGELEPEFAKATTAILDAAEAGPGRSVLDLACGPGHTTHAAATLGANVRGLDLSEEMVKLAKRRFPDQEFSVGDMLQPPAGPWDAIVCRFGAHHVDPAWTNAAFHVLAPGGRIAIAEFDDTTEKAHANGMRNAAYWEQLFLQAGFVEVSVTILKLDLARFEGKELPVPNDTVLIVTGSKAP